MGHGVVITGATRGIGRAIALELAARSFDLLLVARQADGLASVAAAIGGRRAETLALDVTAPDAGQRLLQAAAAAFGTPWGLVNNAGMAESAPLAKTDDELMRRHMELNYFAPMRLMRAIAPAMTGGRVVNVLSTAALVGYPYVSAYAASKHALLGATRSLAREFAGKGITFNAVCPGYVRTEMFAQTVANIAAKTGLSAAQAEDKLLRMTPQNRVFEPQEVAHAVAFLLGEQARGINGQAISIDGGEIEH